MVARPDEAWSNPTRGPRKFDVVLNQVLSGLAGIAAARVSPSLPVLGRVAAATFGGYGMTMAALIVMGAALLFPAQSDPIAAAMLLAAPIWVGLWIWTFSTRRPLRLWAWLAALAALPQKA